MKVSRSGFYAYRKRHNGHIEDPGQAALKARIRGIFNEHRGNYGSRRILKQLQDEGHQLGRYKVRSLMRKLGLKAKCPRRYKVTTDSRHSFLIAANLLERHFDVSEPNTVWTAGITYVWTLEGWSNLAVVMDLNSRQIVGWAIDKRMKNSLRLMPWRWPIGAECR